MELQEGRLGTSTKKMAEDGLEPRLILSLEHFQSPGREGFFNGISSATFVFETTPQL